jgi:hypothetical protein
MEKIPLNKLAGFIQDKIDVFICSSSFEDRCLSISQEAGKLEIPLKLIFYVTDLETKIEQNAKKLASILGEQSFEVAIQIDNPAQTLKIVSEALNKVVSDDIQQNFLMDITTFTHEGLLMLLKLLQLKKKEKDKLFLCYNGAKDYSYNESIPEEKWLTKGVKSVRSILGYPGLLDPSKRNHLVILFGFEGERTRRLIDIFEFDLVSLAFGSKGESISDRHQQLNEARHNELLKFYPDAKDFEISLINADQTKSQLLGYLNDFPEYNTVIAPMNNKISTIGAGLAALEKPEIQLCYVTANQYNFEGYSQPSEDCYLFEVKF